MIIINIGPSLLNITSTLVIIFFLLNIIRHFNNIYIIQVLSIVLLIHKYILVF